MVAKQKILHLTQATGGVKTYVSHVLDYADQNRFDFVIVAPADQLFEAYCSGKSIPYHIADLERGMRPMSVFRVLRKIIKVIRKEKPDIIHAHSAKGGFLGRVAGALTKTKVVYTPHAFSYLSFTGFKRMFFYLLEYSVRKYTTLLLAISHTEASCAIHQLGYPTKKVITIQNSIPIKPHHQRNYNNAVKRIGMIGRLTIQKNPMQFLEIAQQLIKKYPNLQFSILGAGIHDDLKLEIDRYINQHQLGANVTIKSWGNSDTSCLFLKDTDIYLSTSLFEGLPFSLLDAMLCGIPCVVSKVEGNIDVIDNNENGFCCLTVAAFCAKIENLIDNCELRRTIGEAGSAYVTQHHDILKAIKELEEVYLTT